MPKISIIMPVYNAGIYLNAAIDSVLNQTFTELELICVDDGSTDGSGELCDEYAARDERVLVVHQQNAGICAARNNGIAVAKSDYIGFMDHDDVCEPEMLSDSYGLALEHDADVVKYGYRVEETFSNGMVSHRCEHSGSVEIFTESRLTECYQTVRDSGFFFMVWNGLYRKNLFEKVNFNEEIRFGFEDWDFNYRLYTEIRKAVLCPSIYYIHYQRAGSSTSKKFRPERVTGIAIAALSQCLMLDRLGMSSVQKHNALGEKILDILFLFQLSGCDYTAKQRRQALHELSAHPPFRNEDIDLGVKGIDRKKRLVVVLFKKKRYRTLFLVLKLYNVVLRAKGIRNA